MPLGNGGGRRGNRGGQNGERGPQDPGPLQVRLLGRMAVVRDGDEVALPASRKVRALLAHLACSATEVSRSRLCELLWDGPDDPRGELRWCLSKLRSVLDDADHSRVVTKGDTVGAGSGGLLRRRHRS